jgi:hypothetical protein
MAGGSILFFVYRTLGAIPANGAAPGVGDVVVGQHAFGGGPLLDGQSACAFSFLDSGLDATKQYRYYLAVQAPNGAVVTLNNNSQLLVMERS